MPAPQAALDHGAAQTFLAELDWNAARWTFQTFDDDGRRKDGHLARTLPGTLEEHADTLARLNRQGAGVFVTIDETGGAGRSKENITRVRAVWADLDGAPLEPCREWEEPHIIVQTSPGKMARLLAAGGGPGAGGAGASRVRGRVQAAATDADRGIPFRQERERPAPRDAPPRLPPREGRALHGARGGDAGFPCAVPAP